MSRRRAALLVSASAAALAFPELLYWAGARACPAPEPGRSCAVLVLGFGARRDGSPHPMQRHRVATAVAVMRRAGCARMVISGGSPAGRPVEAETMAALAREAGVPEADLVLETKARNTWENVRNTLGELAGFERVYIVSDALHAHRGRRYLCRQEAGACAKAVPAARYRPGELYGLKWWGLSHEAGAAVRDWWRHG